MPKSHRKSHRKSKSHRKAHRKSERKSLKAHRKSKTHRRMRGGVAPVVSGSELNPLQLAQGQQFAEYHKEQHGGALNFGPYPGAVDQASVLPSDLIASSKLLPLNQSFDYIRQFGPSSDNPNLSGGKRRKSRKSRKSRKAERKSRKAHRKSHRKTKAHRKSHRKQRGGLYRWGGGARRLAGGSYAEMRFPMPVAEEGKMLIPSSLQQQAGLNPEWRLAENPNSFAPNM